MRKFAVGAVRAHGEELVGDFGVENEVAVEELDAFDGFVSTGNALGDVAVSDIVHVVRVVPVFVVQPARDGHAYARAAGVSTKEGDIARVEGAVVLEVVDRSVVCGVRGSGEVVSLV